MSTQVSIQRLPPLDDPWRRLAWLLPAAIVTWAVLLLVFARLLEQSAPPAPELKPIEARIVEIPPPAPVGGLQSGAESPAHVVKAITKPAPRPHSAAPRVAPAPPSANGTLRKKSNESPPAAAGDKKPLPAGEESEPGDESETSGEGGGIGGGTDSSGARAIYSPAPVIPDDLREDAIQTEAVASFKVSADGTVEVSLATPTPNPRLNQVLLDALRQWKFFPATRGGVAIDAVFEVRIPITVQ